MYHIIPFSLFSLVMGIMRITTGNQRESHRDTTPTYIYHVTFQKIAMIGESVSEPHMSYSTCYLSIYDIYMFWSLGGRAKRKHKASLITSIKIRYIYGMNIPCILSLVHMANGECERGRRSAETALLHETCQCVRTTFQASDS